jgi:hypothetical protein
LHSFFEELVIEQGPGLFFVGIFGGHQDCRENAAEVVYVNDILRVGGFFTKFFKLFDLFVVLGNPCFRPPVIEVFVPGGNRF